MLFSYYQRQVPPKAGQIANSDSGMWLINQIHHFRSKSHIPFEVQGGRGNGYTLSLPFEGRLFPTHKLASTKLLQQWYGSSFLTNRLRYIPPWEEVERPLFCGTPYHHNCLTGHYFVAPDCRRKGIC